MSRAARRVLGRAVSILPRGCRKRWKRAGPVSQVRTWFTLHVPELLDLSNSWLLPIFIRITTTTTTTVCHRFRTLPYYRCPGSTFSTRSMWPGPRSGSWKMPQRGQGQQAAGGGRRTGKDCGSLERSGPPLGDSQTQVPPKRTDQHVCVVREKMSFCENSGL